MSDVNEMIELDNAKLHAQYLSEHQCYSASELKKLVSEGSSDGQDCVSIWKENRSIFSIYDNDLELFPMFQFHNGKPLEIIRRILSEMPSDMSDWEIALWFASANGYIENEQPPQDSLELEEDLNAAVKALSEEIYW